MYQVVEEERNPRQKTIPHRVVPVVQANHMCQEFVADSKWAVESVVVALPKKIHKLKSNEIFHLKN